MWQSDGSYHHDSNKDIFEHLSEYHNGQNHNVLMVTWNEISSKFDTHIIAEEDSMDHLPFTFRGGHVGYLGYEVRHLTERYIAERENGQRSSCFDEGKSDPQIPTSAFLFSTKTFVFDHFSQEWYLVAVEDKRQPAPTIRSRILTWIRSTSVKMAMWQKEPRITDHCLNAAQASFVPNRSRETYNKNFEDCLELIRNGESYELCLTNQLEARVKAPGTSALELYCVLRKFNPSPFSAFFDWNGKSLRTQTDSSVSICCSSPERFISVTPIKQDDTPSGDEQPIKFQVETKPIKGTARRIYPDKCDDVLRQCSDLNELDKAEALRLKTSVKNQAENLMIVDLLRNDLSRVCDVGSVHVSKLMDIESYATVHQMVSTIRGTFSLNRSREYASFRSNSTVDVLAACFPGGSMTGAPKIRTMQLLHELEEKVCRGPYSGSLGYVSLNGAIDMNKIIRTAILTSDEGVWSITIGAGGAITALSKSDDEYEEMIMKASPVQRAVQEWLKEGFVVRDDAFSEQLR